MQREMTETEAEQHARLHGLMAMLALPPLRGENGTWVRVPVEVEVSPGVWKNVDGLSIEADKFVFFFGTNGARVTWTFDRTDGVPRWRTPEREKLVVGYGSCP